MKPTFELEREHEDTMIILEAMKKMARDMLDNQSVDTQLISQVIDFLRIFVDQCHHEKEERILFPVLLNYEIPSIEETVNHIVKEHLATLHLIDNLEDKLALYLCGRTVSPEKLARSIYEFAILEEDHILNENNVLLPWIDKVLNNEIQERISLEFKIIQKQEVSHDKCIEFFTLLSRLHSVKEEVPEMDFSY